MIKLEVGKKYYIESSENHVTGLKWDFVEFEVLRLDGDFPLNAIIDEVDDTLLEFAIIRVLKSIDLGMNVPGDADLPVEIKEENELLILVRKSDGSWYCTWWAVEASMQEFVERTAEDWVKLKREYVQQLKGEKK